MKVGDYVRFDYHRISVPIQIARITEVHYDITDEDANVCYSTDVGLVISESNLVKESSTNIIDLIEVGDFITYKKGNMYIDIPYRVYGTYNEILEETELRIDDEYLKDIEILSIVTHEQFERMQYNLESEVN